MRPLYAAPGPGHERLLVVRDVLALEEARRLRQREQMLVQEFRQERSEVFGCPVHVRRILRRYAGDVEPSHLSVSLFSPNLSPPRSPSRTSGPQSAF